MKRYAARARKHCEDNAFTYLVGFGWTAGLLTLAALVLFGGAR